MSRRRFWIEWLIPMIGFASLGLLSFSTALAKDTDEAAAVAGSSTERLRLPFATEMIEDAESGLKAWVFRFAPAANRGFGILDVPEKLAGDSVARRFDSKRHVLMVNGGYFDAAFAPDGFCKIDGEVLVPKKNPRLSGFVAIDADGKIVLLGRDAKLDKYRTVLQSGPYVIDPGGKLGIRRKSGTAAWRTLVGTTGTGDLLIVVAEPIYLIDLAKAVKKNLPKIERLLNLDGGPSTGVMTAGGVKHVNTAVVRNYLFRKRERPAAAADEK